MTEFISFAMPKFTFITLLFKKPVLLIAIIPAVVIAPVVISYADVWWLLKWFFVADLLSGLGASYFEWKKSNHNERWFFGKGEGFSSNKAKMFGVKAMVYLNVPDMLIKLQTTLHLKNFKYSSISDAEFELATAVVLFFCLIEGFSIFHENLPKCGFDLWEKIKKIFGLYKEVKKEISE